MSFLHFRLIQGISENEEKAGSDNRGFFGLYCKKENLTAREY
jgi:dTDP-4-dehydrorhamnose 3,5-epimerase-like enzyme